MTSRAAPLSPFPLGALLGRSPTSGRLASGLRSPADAFFDASAAPDLSVEFLGRRAATPLGPAAGPHSQMAQNIVLAWLAGARIVELKTVQILDELRDPPAVHRHGDRGLQRGVEPGAAARSSRSRSTSRRSMLIGSPRVGSRCPAGPRLRRARIFDISRRLRPRRHPSRTDGRLHRRPRRRSRDGRPAPRRRSAEPLRACGPRFRAVSSGTVTLSHVPRLPARRDRGHRPRT